MQKKNSANPAKLGKSARPPGWNNVGKLEKGKMADSDRPFFSLQKLILYFFNEIK